MAVDKASGIIQNLVGQIISNQNLAKADGIKKAESGTSQETLTMREGDKVEISMEAKELHETLQSLKDEINKMPDVREEKIRDVKARMESGFYDRGAVIKDVARALKDSGLL